MGEVLSCMTMSKQGVTEQHDEIENDVNKMSPDNSTINKFFSKLTTVTKKRTSQKQ